MNFSTPVTYGICLNELGEEMTHKYQGRESSGRECNEIVLGPTGIKISLGSVYLPSSINSFIYVLQASPSTLTSTLALSCRPHSS